VRGKGVPSTQRSLSLTVIGCAPQEEVEPGTLRSPSLKEAHEMYHNVPATPDPAHASDDEHHGTPEPEEFEDARPVPASELAPPATGKAKAKKKKQQPAPKRPAAPAARSRSRPGSSRLVASAAARPASKSPARPASKSPARPASPVRSASRGRKKT
jgi:hypothetical protein